jgi:hypothetical protein
MRVTQTALVESPEALSTTTGPNPRRALSRYLTRTVERRFIFLPTQGGSRVKSLVVMLLIPGILTVGHRGASAQYRKIEDGVGNCIFSKSVLGFHKESTFKVTSEFKAGDEVHVRCYFPKHLKEIAQDGKLKNSLRGSLASGAAAIGVKPVWYATMYWSDDKTTWWHTAIFNYIESRDGDNTEQRMDQPPGGAKLDKSACDWKMGKFKLPNECVDIERETRNLGAKLKRKGKYRTEICVNVFYEKIDRTKMINFKEHSIVENPTFSRGCFNYTVDL